MSPSNPDTARHESIDTGKPATDTGGNPGGAGTEPAPPCTLVIFGAGGDLTKRLLMPALYNLSSSHLLADDFKIIGIDRVEQSSEAWRSSLRQTMESFTQDKSSEFYTPSLDQAAWKWIEQRLEYRQGDFMGDALYQDLGQRLKGSVVFYLAVAARFFGPIVQHLGGAGLMKQGEANDAADAAAKPAARPSDFRRVVIEKPFGADLPSAQALNRQILSCADESQIYRIDHFLGKETVQSIMAMRFANGMFEPLWRREFIDHVQITAAETIGVEQRGSFYEPTGALRDMVPNHLFTLLAMTAMEPPNSFEAEAVRSEKSKVIEALRPVALSDVVRGQYAAGTLQGQAVRAYREEPNVAPDSQTETYVAMRLNLDNWRWGGVPFYLRTGKRLGQRYTETAVHFKAAPYQLFRDTPVTHIAPNVLRLQIDPEHGCRIEFNAKVPGPVMDIGRVGATFRYADFFSEKPNVGYETLLYDCMLGDATLFQRADGIEASWAAVQPALSEVADLPVQLYASGSNGPAAADELLARDARKWTTLDPA